MTEAARDHDVDVYGVTKSYGGAPAVDDVSFVVGQGHLLSMLGPSGCGKTTMLRMIAGLIVPDAGGITVKGRSITNVPVHKRNIGLLFQNYALFPHMTVAANVAFGLEMRGVAASDIRGKVERALDLVQLSGFAGRMPHQLSGGQQQRVALARAIVIEPAVLLLDEPLGALDKSLRESMQIELRALQQRLGITTIMVTHDQEEALTMSDRIAVMRGGKIEQIGGPSEIYERPATRFVASFIGASNFFDGAAVPISGGAMVDIGDGLRLQTVGPEARGRVTVAVRPEAVQVMPAAGHAPAPNQVAATVDQIVYRGVSTQLHLRLPSGRPLLAFRQNAGEGVALAIQPGDAVLASWDAERNRIVRDDA
ncbi:ABC transporter ATP-binding protein [Alsobacter sp. KACC 23698]|uniref:Spermidine/putrescine import ATP-binding protein PotA n=1 Tax=Alsobacter sp. KACC 23698 TaxID=3149229 RepID=A0AAU7JE99_9HYPH